MTAMWDNVDFVLLILFGQHMSRGGAGCRRCSFCVWGQGMVVLQEQRELLCMRQGLITAQIMEGDFLVLDRLGIF